MTSRQCVGRPLWLACALLLAAAVGAQPPSVSCRLVPDDEAPRIDGELTEPVWREADWFDGFRQSVPDLGEPAVEPTAVAFLVDSESLYVGVRCTDSRPDLIRARKLRHRDEPQTDDHVEIILDTYQDQIRGTVFVFNPLGAKEEGLVNGYHHYTWDWNEVWEVRTEITPEGWQAEVRIPLRVLRFGSAPEQTWGVNVTRVVRRLQEESYLSPPPPPYDISSLNFAGWLTGIELVAERRNLQLIPYGLGGVVRESTRPAGGSDSDEITEAGLDVKYSLTSDLVLNGTFNTDFSQVEADDVQVNLTRFSLFYPEKREFFLENADLFTFGHIGGFGSGAPDVTPFFSRRIGLYRGETVPIDGGLRLTGKMGRQDVGVLSVRTGGVADLDLASAWYNVVRLRRDLGGRSYVGGILTDVRSVGSRSTTVGVDGTWYLTRDLSLLGHAMVVDDGSSGDRSSATYVGLDLTTDPWGFLFDYREVADGFEPAVGFVRRAGYRRGFGTLRRSIRPGRWGVRRVSFRLFGDGYESLVHDRTESTSANLSCELELENGDEIQVRATRSFERLFEPFELDEELVFPAGGYSFVEGSVSYGSDASRRWGVDAALAGGDFFDGRREQLEGELWVVFSRHLRSSVSYARYHIDSDHGAVDWCLSGLRVDSIFTPKLSASAFLQRDSSTGTTLVNLRLRWILRNDSDLYLVYDDSEVDETGLPARRRRELVLKASWRFFL